MQPDTTIFPSPSVRLEALNTPLTSQDIQAFYAYVEGVMHKLETSSSHHLINGETPVLSTLNLTNNLNRYLGIILGFLKAPSFLAHPTMEAINDFMKNSPLGSEHACDSLKSEFARMWAEARGVNAYR